MGGWPLHCRMFNSISSLNPLDASSSPTAAPLTRGVEIAPVKNYICSVCGLLSRLSVGPKSMDLLNKDLGARHVVGCCLDREELRPVPEGLTAGVDCGSPGRSSQCSVKRAADV